MVREDRDLTVGLHFCSTFLYVSWDNSKEYITKASQMVALKPQLWQKYQYDGYFRVKAEVEWD